MNIRNGFFGLHNYLGSIGAFVLPKAPGKHDVLRAGKAGRDAVEVNFLHLFCYVFVERVFFFSKECKDYAKKVQSSM